MGDLDRSGSSDRTGPHRVRREKNKLCFGGAALIASMAAYRRVCLPFGGLAFRVTWIAALFLSFAASSPSATQQNLPVTASAAAADDASPFTSATPPSAHQKDEQAATSQTQSLQRTAPASDQPQAVIQRIEFTGNRRIRQDTLKARIFSRDGDPYNEETLRRDFQALWNLSLIHI